MESDPTNHREDLDSHTISLTDLTLEKAVCLLQEKLKENSDLREAMADNNAIMKQHYTIILSWKDKIASTNTNNKERFTESMSLIQDLKKRNIVLEKEKEDFHLEKIQLEQRIEELHEIYKNLKSESLDIERKYHKEKSHNEKLQEAIGKDSSVEVLVAHTEEKSEKIVQMEQKFKNCEDQRKNLEITNIHLTNDIKSFKEHTDQLINDLKNMSLMKETLQLENNKLTDENLYHRQEYQELLAKYALKSYNTTESLQSADLSSKMEDYELKSYEKLSNILNDNNQLPVSLEDKQTEQINDIMTQLSKERSHVNSLRSQNKMLEEKIQQIQLSMDGKLDEQEQEYSENLRKLQNKHQAEIEMLRLTNPDMRVVESMAVDQETLKRQVMNLLNEVKETQEEKKSLKELLANKNNRCRQLEEANIRAKMEMERQHKQDAQLIETLQYSIQSYDKKLIAEREHTNIKQDQNRKLREAFSQLLDDYKQLLTINNQLEQEMKNNSSKNLMEKIDHLTAQLVAAEESLDLKKQTTEKLTKQLEKCTAENDQIPILKAQTDIYKGDFDAEREAREKQHQEIDKLKERVQNLELQNRELLDQLESASREQLSEMRQRCYPPNMPYALYANQTARPQQRNVAYVHGQRVIPNYHVSSSMIGNEPRQHEEEEFELQCPLCKELFPDQDSLKLHVEEHA